MYSALKYSRFLQNFCLFQGCRWPSDFVFFPFGRKFVDFQKNAYHSLDLCGFSLSSSSFKLSGYTSFKLIEEWPLLAGGSVVRYFLLEKYFILLCQIFAGGCFFRLSQVNYSQSRFIGFLYEKEDILFFLSVFLGGKLN